MQSSRDGSHPGVGTILPSCDRCRARKVKCDRAHPRCSNCSQAKADCVYQPGRGRAPKRPRVVPEPQIIERLSRLEKILRQAGPSNSQESSKDSSLDEPFGRLLINDKSSYYVSHGLWSTLANEVEELRDLLLKPTNSDDESEQAVNAPGFQANRLQGLLRDDSNAAIFGYRAVAHSLHRLHPSSPQAVELFTAFTERVAPLVHVFHLPSLAHAYGDAIASLESIDRNTEALLFAIYYSSVISFEPSECMNVLGKPREEISGVYRFAVEQALARADLLNTQSMTLLQAAVVFLTALQNQDESRTTWSLTALIYHIAQAMGLHRDAEAFGLKPFETELRRRLWWQILFLDGRSSENGSHDPIQEFVPEVKPPLHINDSDLQPNMTDPPLERWGEATDMTLPRMRCEAIIEAWKLGLKLRRTPLADTAKGVTVEEREIQLKELKHTFHEKFVRHCNISPSAFHQYFAAPVARLIPIGYWLEMQYPSTSSVQKDSSSEEKPGGNSKDARSKMYSTEFVVGGTSDTMRERLFQASIQLLEITVELLTHPQARRWAWYARTHIQWAPVVFALGEICTRPPSADCDRAWTLVNIVHEAWKMRQSSSKGVLSLPIQRLMAKARNVREMAQPSYPAKPGEGPDLSQQHRYYGSSTGCPDCISFASSSATGDGLNHTHPHGAAPLAPAQTVAMPEASWPTNSLEEDQMLQILSPQTWDNFTGLLPDTTQAPNPVIFYDPSTTGNDGEFQQSYLHSGSFLHPRE